MRCKYAFAFLSLHLILTVSFNPTIAQSIGKINPDDCCLFKATNALTGKKTTGLDALKEVVTAINERVRPHGIASVTKENEIKIQLDSEIKGKNHLLAIDLVQSRGEMSFNLVGTTHDLKDRSIIQKANRLNSHQKSLMKGAEKVAFWATFDNDLLREYPEIELVTRTVSGTREVLILTDDVGVTGNCLVSSKIATVKNKCELNLIFNNKGPRTFKKLLKAMDRNSDDSNLIAIIIDGKSHGFFGLKNDCSAISSKGLNENVGQLLYNITQHGIYPFNLEAISSSD